MMKRMVLLSLLILFISGCSGITGKDSFQNSVKNIAVLLEEERWPDVRKECRELLNIYRKNEWKLQLIGDEEEYEELFKCINRLLTIAEEQDKVRAKMELATIRTIIENIYSL